MIVYSTLGGVRDTTSETRSGYGRPGTGGTSSSPAPSVAGPPHLAATSRSFLTSDRLPADAFHAAALETDGADEGAPGVRLQHSHIVG